jgi:hypothetical protein
MMHFRITHEPSSTSKPEDDPPVVPKLEGPGLPGLSSLSPRPIFLQSQAYLPSVLDQSSLGPRSTFPCPRSIVPQFHTYLPSVAGPIFAVAGLSSLSARPIFPQSQVYLPAVSGLSEFFDLVTLTPELLIQGQSIGVALQVCRTFQFPQMLY